MSHGVFWTAFLWCISQVGSELSGQDHVVLDCTKGGPSISVTWIGGSTPTYNASYPVSSCCSMRTNVVEENDTQTSYFCLPSYNGSLNALRLEMKDDELDPSDTLSELVTCQGTDIALFCDPTEDRSSLNVAWRRRRSNSDSQIFPGKKLQLRNVQRSDEGTYICETKLKEEETKANKILRLVVEFPPIISVPATEVKGLKNEECRLRCLIEAFPVANVTWFKDDIPLVDDDNSTYLTSLQETKNCTLWATLLVMVQVHTFEGSNETNESLTLNELSDSYGNYTCQAENKHGRTSAVLRLIAGSSEPISPVDPFEGRRFNVTGFIIGMMPPLCISFYIIVKLGYRSRYAQERPEDDGVREEPFFVSY